MNVRTHQNDDSAIKHNCNVMAQITVVFSLCICCISSHTWISLLLVHSLIAYKHILHSHNMGLHHNAKVRNQICKYDMILEVYASCAHGVMSWLVRRIMRWLSYSSVTRAVPKMFLFCFILFVGFLVVYFGQPMTMCIFTHVECQNTLDIIS